MKRLILLGLLGGLLATNAGCGLCHAIFCYNPCAMRGDRGPAVSANGCDDTCGPTRVATRAPVCGPRRARVYADGDTGCDAECGRPCRKAGCRSCDQCDPCADPCGTGGYSQPWYRGPLSCVFALVIHPCSGCGGGCGERYWGDFYSDPPDCWDPCDGYGNYTGGSGCRSCGGGYAGTTGGIDGYTRSPAGGRFDDTAPDEKIVSQTDRSMTSTGQPHRAVRSQP